LIEKIKMLEDSLTCISNSSKPEKDKREIKTE
jgi:hypothetical protein